MGSLKSQLQGRTWQRDGYLISTDPGLISIPRLISIFASDEVYWTSPLPEPCMREMVESSLCFGLYSKQQQQPNSPSPSSSNQQQPEPKSSPGPPAHLSLLVGFARCVTDFTSFLYVTDVWVEPSLQGRGLGGWLVGCVQEVIESMPYLRRSMLLTGDWERSVPFYERLMGMELMKSRKGEGLAVMERKGPGHPSYRREGSGYN
ncbi:hypothetical protein F5X96DRAFT_631162 [Biscogniauxia mediterranea]|nr:hypothetical protein F5X96DRAFT_631162 [Biscogniauxia mediterranea]